MAYAVTLILVLVFKGFFKKLCVCGEWGRGGLPWCVCAHIDQREQHPGAGVTGGCDLPSM